MRGALPLLGAAAALAGVLVSAATAVTRAAGRLAMARACSRHERDACCQPDCCYKSRAGGQIALALTEALCALLAFKELCIVLSMMGTEYLLRGAGLHWRSTPRSGRTSKKVTSNHRTYGVLQLGAAALLQWLQRADVLH